MKRSSLLYFLNSPPWTVCIIVVLLALPAFSQTKPAAAKPKTTTTPAKPASTTTAKPAAAKPATSAKPVSKTPLKPATGTQSVTSKPAPARQTTTPAAQPVATTPTKTATTPTTPYKAQSNTYAAAKPAVKINRRVSRGNYGYNAGDKLLNIGLGLSSYYRGTPIGFSYESGIHEDISVGGQFDFSTGGYNGGYRAYYLGVRASCHFNRLLNINDSKIDFYAGAGLGYRSWRWVDSYYSNYNSGLYWNGFIGGKYYFTNKTSAFLELGYAGLSSSRIGVAFKF